MSEGINTTIDEVEVSLLDIVAVIWKWKRMIICVVSTAVLFIVSFSIISILLPPDKSFYPNEYTPRALMLINDSSSSGGSSASLLSSSGMGGLASLAGLSVPSGKTYSRLAEFLVKTNEFLDTVIEKYNLVERYKVDKFPKSATRDILREKLIAEIDDESGVFSIKFTDIDPVFAQDVVNFSVAYMEQMFEKLGVDKSKLQKQNLEMNLQNALTEIQNLEIETRELGQTIARGGTTTKGQSVVLEMNRLAMELTAQKSVYIELKAQYELLKVQMASESPVFQILELAEVPDRKSGPSRGMLCIVVTFVAVFIALLLTFILEYIDKTKSDTVTMERLSRMRKQEGER